MSTTNLEGSCQCGQVAYRLDAAPLRLNVCHCRDCQRQSGSAFGMSLVVTPTSFQLTQGELSFFNLKADSGLEKTCGFCPNCGVRIFNRTDRLMSIKFGTLNETTGFTPDAHYWVHRKQSWVETPDDVPCFEAV